MPKTPIDVAPYPLPLTAREALWEIRRKVATMDPAKVVSLVTFDEVAQEGLDANGLVNYQLSDRLADRLAEALDLLGKLREPGGKTPVRDIDAALALPPDLEAMIERRLGEDRVRPESAEDVRLELGNILVEGRSEVMRKAMVEKVPLVREALGEFDELIQAMFERFAPERWAEELAKSEAAEAAAAGGDEERIKVIAKVLYNLSHPGDEPWKDLPTHVRGDFIHKARQVWAAEEEFMQRQTSP